MGYSINETSKRHIYTGHSDSDGVLKSNSGTFNMPLFVVFLKNSLD